MTWWIASCAVARRVQEGRHYFLVDSQNSQHQSRCRVEILKNNQTNRPFQQQEWIISNMRANWVISTELGQNFFYLASPGSSLNYSAQVYTTLQTKVKLNVLGMSTKYWFIVLFNGFAAAAARITSCIIKVTAQLGCRDTGSWGTPS